MHVSHVSSPKDIKRQTALTAELGKNVMWIPQDDLAPLKVIKI